MILFLLTGIILLSIILGYAYSKKDLERNVLEKNTKNIDIKNNTINFSSLTLQQKIAQMTIVRGDEFDGKFNDLNIGGIFLDRQSSLKDYKELIQKYQNNSKIKLIVSTDFEGAWSPFTKANISEKEFPKFSDIKTPEKAYEVGLKQGVLLNKLGFNINFAPVAEFEDKAYGGRVFAGTKKEIENKLKKYIQGLQKTIPGTCKHYPGKGMIKNTHYLPDKRNITKSDLDLFEICFKSNISSIMVGHQKVYGELNSKNKPSSVSKEVIDSIKGDSIIISDEINMWGLKIYYLFNKRVLYKDLINSGNNLILDFKINSQEMEKILKDLEKKVEKGEISEEKINNSVRKILKLKGYNIKN